MGTGISPRELVLLAGEDEELFDAVVHEAAARPDSPLEVAAPSATGPRVNDPEAIVAFFNR